MMRGALFRYCSFSPLADPLQEEQHQDDIEPSCFPVFLMRWKTPDFLTWLLGKSLKINRKYISSSGGFSSHVGFSGGVALGVDPHFGCRDEMSTCWLIWTTSTPGNPLVHFHGVEKST